MHTTIHPISSSTFIIFSFIVLYFTVLLLLLINEFLFCSVHHAEIALTVFD